jgi:TM2 domain-containing membrane protein YozV
MAATMALGWLVARRVPFYAAFGLSLAFMLDPLFVFSQRMARPDSWVLALCFACCWLLRETTNKDHSFERWHIMAAGGLAATAAFIWPSAVLIYPLIILELFQVAKAGKEVAYRNKYILSLVLYFTVGGLIFAVLLLLPIWQNLLIILNDMTTLLSQNVDPSKTSQDRFFSFFNIESWLTMMRTFRRAFSPVFPLLALAGIVLHREKGLILVFIVTLFIIFASRVYSLRVLYLLPYLLVLGSGIFIQSKESQSNLLKSLRIITLSVLLAWSVGISLLIRTALGLEGKSERNRDKIYQVAVSKIGKGNHNVFLGFTYEFYFVGRSLGWKLYTPYILYSNNEQGKWEMPYKPTPEFLELLSKMDYVIIPKGTVTEKLDVQVARSNVELEKQLASSGLYFSSTFRLGEDGYQNRTKEFLLWLFQGRGLAFLQGKDSYGSYMLYARVKNGKSDKVSLSSR